MPFRKGKSGNPKGKPLGTKSKTTLELKNLVQCFLETNLENLQTDFDSLEAYQRLQFIDKMLGFVLPKPQTIEVNDATPRPIQISVTSPKYADELQKLYAEMDDDPGAMKIEVTNQQTAEKLAKWMNNEPIEPAPIQPRMIPNPRAGYRKTHI